MKKIQIKLNKELRNFKAGTVLVINVDASGNPLDVYWRKRLKDAEIDQCISIEQKKKESKKEIAKKD